jgi:hypothetical protein
MSSPAAAPAERTETLFRVGIWVGLYALPVAVGLLPVVDHDIWWHLRTGQWIVESGTVPAADPFSQYGLVTGKPWVAYSWLFEVFFFGLYSHFGFGGIFLARAALTLAIVVALHRHVGKREPRFLVAAGVTIVAILGMLPLFAERPWLFTILFGILTLDTILDIREGKWPWTAWLLPLVYVLWANLHIQFVYGLFLLGLACAAPWGDRLLRRESRADSGARAGSRLWWWLVALTGACTLATLVSPYHYHLYQVVLEHATQREPLQQVAEMRAMEFRGFWDWCVLGLAVGAAFSLGRRQHFSSFEVLLLLAGAWFGFRACRDVWFVVLASLATITTAGRAPGVACSFLPSWRQALVVAGAVVPLLAGFWLFAHTGPAAQATLEATFPVQAVAFVRERGYRGPLYNNYNWGGYLMWALPELPVSMDGRANLHGDARLVRSAITWQGRPGWDGDPELLAAGVIIADIHAPLTALLRRTGRFEVVHEDPVAVVLVPRDVALAP